MASTLPVNIRACLTCRYWDGGREVLFGGANRPAFVRSESRPAPCIANENRAYLPNALCPKYQRWEKL